MPVSASKRYELATRREIGRNLFNLGMTVQDVATALGLDSSSVYNDFNQLGGRDAFPIPDLDSKSHSERRDIVYSLAFKMYAKIVMTPIDQVVERVTHDGLIEALAAYLDIKYLHGIAEGVWSANRPRMFPVDSEEYQGYRELLRAVFGARRSDLLRFLYHKKKMNGEGLFELYVKDVSRGKKPPTRTNFSDSFALWAAEGFDHDVCMRFTEASIRLIESTFSTISPKEEKVIRMTFGIGCEKLTLKACGQELACNKERIRQIQAKALRKLRHPHRSRKLSWVTMNPENLADGFLAEMAEQHARLELPPNAPNAPSVEKQMDARNMTLGGVLEKSVEELELSVRTYYCLKNGNIQTVRELVQLSEAEFLRIRNTGRKSLNELKEVLSSLGRLRFGMKFDTEGNLVTPLLE